MPDVLAEFTPEVRAAAAAGIPAERLSGRRANEWSSRLAAVAPRVLEAVRAGKTGSDLTEAMLQELDSIGFETAKAMDASLRRAAARFDIASQRVQASVSQWWEPSFAYAVGVVLLVCGLVDEFINAATTRARRDHLVKLTVMMFRRGQLTSMEILTLARHGLPDGALARCRTLHELEVQLLVMAVHGRRYALADKYADHLDVQRARDAEAAMNCGMVVGNFVDPELASLVGSRERLVAKYARRSCPTMDGQAVCPGCPLDLRFEILSASWG